MSHKNFNNNNNKMVLFNSVIYFCYYNNKKLHMKDEKIWQMPFLGKKTSILPSFPN